MDAKEVALNARRAADNLAQATTEQKDLALLAMAERLEQRRDEVVEANRQDMEAAAKSDVPENMVKRLAFGADKIDSRIESLGLIASLPDPVGQSFKASRRPNGLEVARVRVPLGVILMIYEARPHVTVNAGAFCLKSGNAAILRGGSEARRCNELLGEFWVESLREADLPAEAVQVVTGSHSEIQDLLKMKELIDLVIPRGGKKLIETVHNKSDIPVVKHFEGICHVYVDRDADLDEAVDIVLDSKCLMPSVCNAAETMLIHKSRIDQLPDFGRALNENGVDIKGCERTRSVLEVDAATEDDWRTEYLDRIISIRMVDTLDQAIEHINTYGSHHTDSIVTKDIERANRFRRRVDSGVVLVNASTMFCDGKTLGMGAEIGISTDKLHARGPMGLEELTSYKFVIGGEGQVMGSPEEWGA